MSEKGKKQKQRASDSGKTTEVPEELLTRLRSMATVAKANGSPEVDFESVMGNFAKNVDSLHQRLIFFDDKDKE